MKLIIPFAGKDRRFEEAYGDVKPLIIVRGKTILEWCLQPIPLQLITEIIFIYLEEDQRQYHIADRLRKIIPRAFFVSLSDTTEGAACSVLSTKKNINTDEDILIFLSDIYFRGDFLTFFSQHDSTVEGIIATFSSTNPRHSYAAVRSGTEKEVERVAEKEIISSNASAGCYYFSHGRDFVWAAEEMIRKNLRVNNSFYICPVYNQLIEQKRKIRIFPVEFIAGFGSPEEVQQFQNKK